MLDSKFNNTSLWSELKISGISSLSKIYPSEEANTILQILGEELFPNYGKLQFRDKNFELRKEEKEIFSRALQRLIRHEPLQYILNKAWFYDIQLKVNKNVLIPRPETEELVNWIISDFSNFSPSILDIGTGSGCIPLALKKHLPLAKITGVDINSKALTLAKENAAELNLDISFNELDVLNSRQWEKADKVDVIVSNPPYIPYKEKSKMGKNVLQFEPHLALFVDNDNAIVFYEKIADFGKEKLNLNGSLYFECNEYNADLVATMLEQKNYSEIKLRKDLQGKKRMLKANLNERIKR